MTASSVMDPHPTVLKPTDIIRTATGYIMKHRYRNLAVVDEEGHYLGVFGVNCLLRLVLPKAAIMERGLTNLSFIQDTLADLHQRLREVENEPISVCMNDEAPVVRPDTPLVEALLTLYRSRSSLPVVDRDSGLLLGMISYWDVGEKILAA